ncbi:MULTISPECIES: MobF family relaxase [unclassified Nocardioides]|uniref:MobF family relaxase n=1 Tax=unclassified Nocardioides TaxID=2615069 RepID=UPI0007032B71|nr:MULTISPECIES: MobF family relaxase [unclassified Nocardioides]KRC54736.1 conjugal transfer protein [Nocardioides sp. Root79]KRC73919.1 conjugal transfer protein [Nocardioides sp. Root240]
MTVSMRRMSAGTGYQYLLRSVVAGDGDRAMSTPLTRYYAETGTPPGRWMGSGLAAFGDGRLHPGMQVSEAQLALLIGMGRDPVTGDQLGLAYPTYKKLSARIEERVAGLDPEMTQEDCAAETSRIEAEETKAGSRNAVAGFDLTFSVPKSVSVLWGVADAATQERIVNAHHAAVSDVLAYFEREVAATRAGLADRDGAVAQVGVAGVAAVAYDHYDSRAGDPQLHTHLVLSNKVLTLRDGQWRSLDGRPVFASVTGLSAHYNALLADRLTRDLGVEWELRQRGADRNPQWEIVGVSDELIAEFSSRTREIELRKDELIAEYVARHGRMPSAKTIVELRAQATLATRPPKETRSLADLTAQWRQRAAAHLGLEPTSWAATLLDNAAGSLNVDDVPLAAIEAIGADVVTAVSVKRSVWSHWNLLAEVSKQTMDMRFASTAEREAVVAMVVDAAQFQSVALTPPELAISPVRFQREDGTSIFRPRHSVKYSSTAVIEAETRLLDRSEKTTAPSVPPSVVMRAIRDAHGALSAEQRTALESITDSGRLVDLLVGPAGAGKTTTMHALRSAWVHEHGRGSVVGLAPSATAAQALADDLRIACDNTAKWLYEYDHGRTQLRPGQLVIIDEATLAGTTSLDRISGIAAGAGAKLLLVGDPHQLQSIDAGGAFALLVDRRTDAPELTEIHRFKNKWEKHASLALRRGEAEVMSTYARQDRIREGMTDDMLDAAYEAWRADTNSGVASLLVAESARAVQALNERARAERLLVDGAVNGREVHLTGGSRASVGDVVITRRNDRTIETTARGWVMNGDRWRITDIRRDGSVAVNRLDLRRRGSSVLPAEYVEHHLDLGYAVTAHRAQGITVDTSHVVVTPTTTRENLYVSMSRGRDSNIAYVALDQPDDSHSTPELEDVTARTVLFGVLQHSGASLSAHQTMEAEYAIHGGIARLAAELETIAADAQRDRFVDLLNRSGLTADQLSAAVESAAFGPLTSALRRAEAYHHDLEALVPRIVRQHGLDDADDIAAVLRHRTDRVASSSPRGCRLHPRLIAGLIPEPLGVMSIKDRQALDQRKELIESRARMLADMAICSGDAWVRCLAELPSRPWGRDEWLGAAITVAAYRDRYNITSVVPVGAGLVSETQWMDRQRALGAVRDASCLGRTDRGGAHLVGGGSVISAP